MRAAAPAWLSPWARRGIIGMAVALATTPTTCKLHGAQGVCLEGKLHGAQALRYDLHFLWSTRRQVLTTHYQDFGAQGWLLLLSPLARAGGVQLPGCRLVLKLRLTIDDILPSVCGLPRHVRQNLK